MRKVGYCSAGTVVSFDIPNGVYDTHSRDAAGSGTDLHGRCAVLGRVAETVRKGGPAVAGPDEMAAACAIWRFFNQTAESADDIMVVDRTGDGKSVEFAPMADLACGIESCCQCHKVAVMRGVARC